MQLINSNKMPRKKVKIITNSHTKMSIITSKNKLKTINKLVGNSIQTRTTKTTTSTSTIRIRSGNKSHNLQLQTICLIIKDVSLECLVAGANLCPLRELEITYLIKNAKAEVLTRVSRSNNTYSLKE